MARKKVDDNKLEIGNIRDVSGEVNIATGDIYKGFTSEQVSVLIAKITTTFQPKKFDGRCPYKGLDVFEEEDAELFFGREKLIEDLVSRVKDSRTVFVTGPSGSGKSSLVRAGLIHALKQGAINNSERWLYATMKPGRDPISELGRVASSLAGSTNAEDEIRFKAMDDATIFARWCEIALKEGRDKRVVLFIDQFEEAFTQINSEAERAVFLNLLTYAATVENGRVITLFSMRSDFVSNCATYPQLNAILNQQFVQIGAMQPEELVSAIAQPALRVGLRIDPDLIAQIINEMKGEPGALPLMQFALKDLFDSQQEKSGVIALTLNDYLQRGGIHKALERHADNSFSKLSKNEQELARSIFSGLIEIGRGTQDTRRTALFDELVPANTIAVEVESIVQKLADARLITTDEQAGKDTVTISHEKLIDAWPWLKKLVNENRDVIALQNQIAADAKEWEDRKRDTSYLYTGGRLANVREQLEKQKLALGHLAQEFVRVGRARQRRAQAFLISAVSIVLIASFVASVIFQNQAQANVEIANTAQAASTFAVQQQGTAQANAEEAQKQTTIALARQLAAQAQSINTSRSSKQMIAVLLAIESMKVTPSGESAQILQNNLLAIPLAKVTHGDTVVSVAFSPDGKYVVSGSSDGTARAWEAITGKEIARMTHEKAVTSVSFSSDGRYVLSGSSDGTARVWETISGKEISRTIHSPRFVSSTAFSPNGKYAASGSYDGAIHIWEVSTGEELDRMEIQDSKILSIAFSPDGKWIISSECYQITNIVRFTCNQYNIRIREITTGKEISHMEHNGWISSVAFSSDGKYVISASWDRTARVWEAVTGKEISRTTHDDVVSSAAFSPDGKYSISGGRDNTVHLWETATGKEIARMLHDSPVIAVSFSPNGKYAVSGSDDFTVRLWAIDSGKEIFRMTHDNWVQVVAFSPDSKYIVSGGFDNTARTWDVSTDNEVIPVTYENLVASMTFSKDGRYLASGVGKTIRVLDVTTGNSLPPMLHDDQLNFMVFSPDGNFLASASDDGTARIWDTVNGQEVTRMIHKDAVDSVAFSPSGKFLISGSDDGTVTIWDAFTGKAITHMIHQDEVHSVAFSPDGKHVASAGSDSTIRIWDAASGEEILRIKHESWVNFVTFSPNGKFVASASDDHTARVWDAVTGQEIARMTHDKLVRSVAISPDSKYVVSGSNDNTARVWDAATGKEVARMNHNEYVTSLTFSIDGKYVISDSIDNTLRVWIYRSDDLINHACSRLPRNLTRAEWKQYIGDALPYQAVCENLPIEPEVISTPTVTP